MGDGSGDNENESWEAINEVLMALFGIEKPPALTLFHLAITPVHLSQALDLALILTQARFGSSLCS
jgi:hypothetical protein